MSIYVSIMSASKSHADSQINMAIEALAGNLSRKMREGVVPSSPSLDITFLLPGEHEKPPFDGMRMGGFTQDNDTLFFECSVPEGMIQSSRAEVFVAAVLEDVIDNAGTYFAASKTPFSRPSWKHSLREYLPSGA